MKKKVRSRLHPDGPTGDIAEPACLQKGTEHRLGQLVLPALMRRPLIVALPIQIGFIAKTAGKVFQKFPTASAGCRARGYGAGDPIARADL
jgi:hypothetical protein